MHPPGDQHIAFPGDDGSGVGDVQEGDLEPREAVAQGMDPCELGWQSAKIEQQLAVGVGDAVGEVHSVLLVLKLVVEGQAVGM